MSSNPSVSRWKFFSRMSSDSCSMHSRGCQQGPKASGCLPATRTSSWGLRQKCRASLSCGWLLWPPLQRVGSLICRGPSRRDGTILLELSLPLSLHAQGPRLQLRLPTTTMLGPLAEAGVFTRTAEPDISLSKKHMSYESTRLCPRSNRSQLLQLQRHIPRRNGPRARQPRLALGSELACAGMPQATERWPSFSSGRDLINQYCLVCGFFSIKSFSAAPLPFTKMVSP